MSTCLRLLYIVFWMVPVQRYCTVVGLGLMAGVGSTLYSPGPLSDWLLLWGYVIALAGPLLLGGAFWRALSAPRAVSLAPRGRLRLLLGALAVAAVMPLSVLVVYGLHSLVTPPAVPVGASGTPWMLVFLGMGRELLTTVAPWIALWLVASFIASRSPLAMLLVLVTAILTVSLLSRFDLLGSAPPRRLLEKAWNIGLLLAALGLFAAWYLLARRIRPPGWLLPGGQSLLATVALADTAVGSVGRRVALERLLLGGSSVPRLLTQWLLAYAVLLLLLSVMALQGPDEARLVARQLFAALILFPAIVAVQAVAIVRRTRALWLSSGLSRLELFAFTRHVLLKFALGMALLFAALLLLLWSTQPWHPALTVAQVLALLVLPGLLAVACALFRPGGQVFYWPAVALVLWLIAWRPLAATGNWDSASGLLWDALAAAAIILQFALARQRWQVEDLPRPATSRSPAS